MVNMSLLNFVKSNPSFFLFVDPSIVNLGYAVFHCKSPDNKTIVHTLVRSGMYNTSELTDKDTYVRCYAMSEFVMALARESQAKRIYIETPPDTIYEQKNLNKDQIIARAQSVAKLTAATYSIFQAGLDNKFTCLPILPVQWEMVRGKKNGGAKAWSLQYANTVAAKDVKQIIKDQNEADAITMGDVIMRKLAGMKFTL